MITLSNKYRSMTTTKSGKPCIQAEVKNGFKVGDIINPQEARVDEHGKSTWYLLKVKVLEFGKPYDYMLESGYVTDHSDYQNDDFVVTERRQIKAQNVYRWEVIEEALR